MPARSDVDGSSGPGDNPKVPGDPPDPPDEPGEPGEPTPSEPRPSSTVPGRPRRRRRRADRPSMTVGDVASPGRTRPGGPSDPAMPSGSGEPAGPGEPAMPSGSDEPAVAPPRLIATPTHPVLGPVTTPAELAEAVRRLRAGTGPVAVDAERASGYRYSQRAYLVQLARAGSGIVLIDPIPFNDDTHGGDGHAALSSVQEAIGDAEWVLHAASQDLPGLREIGLEPASIFDTETAGRLLGLERVSLASMLERFLDVTLEKGHSAADWSQRPLPAEWLVYAALDVDLLVELRDAVEAELIRAGKRAWAEQEWASTLSAPSPGPRTDPWRRTSGVHAVRSRRALAGVRALWLARDDLARARDIAPGRILPDAAIVAAVRANPDSVDALTQLATFRGPRQRQHARRWIGALDEARRLSEAELPPAAIGSRDGMPAPTRWRERDPAAADRLQVVRAVVNTVADQRHVQAQNLLAADVVRRLCWTPPSPVDDDTVATALARLGARLWQVELCAAPIAAALSAPAKTPSPPETSVPPESDPGEVGADASGRRPPP